MLRILLGQKEKESCTPSCHPYQVSSYLRASLSFSRRTSASLLKPSSSSSSSNTPRSPHNSAWHDTPGSNGDRRPPIPIRCSQLLARRRETQESACYSLRRCRVTWKKRNKSGSAGFGLANPPPRPGAPRPGPHSTAGRRLSPPRPGLHQSARPAPLGPAHLASGSQSEARPAARAVLSWCRAAASAAVSSAAMAALRGRALLLARLRAGPRAPLHSAASAPPLYDVLVSGGGMVGSAMAAVLGKAVTRSPAVGYNRV